MRAQYFGTSTNQTANTIREIMLCMDVDRPAECMVHLWGGEAPPIALLCNLQNRGNDAYAVTPRQFYAVGERGGIYPAPVPDAMLEEYNSIRVDLQFENDNACLGTWSTSTANGSFSLTRPGYVEIAATECTSWQEFQAWASAMRRDKKVVFFRGHGSNGFHLETTLQRLGRNRLERYVEETLHQFRVHAEAALNVRIDTSNGDDYAMLLGLAQHFGLPTPLLDWTASPYVAAFFAFSDALENKKDRPQVEKVRVLGLTEDFIRGQETPSVVLSFFKPYVSPLSMSFRNNPRLYAQQGSFTVTNHINMEHVIRQSEIASGRQQLFAADLPVNLAVEVLQDLKYMGISGATLFPGLDGVTRMLKHEMAFGHPAFDVITKPSEESSDDNPGQTS